MSTHKIYTEYRTEVRQTGTLHDLVKEKKVASPEVLPRSKKLSGRIIGNDLGTIGRPTGKMKSANFMSSVPGFLFLYL